MQYGCCNGQLSNSLEVYSKVNIALKWMLTENFVEWQLQHPQQPNRTCCVLSLRKVCVNPKTPFTWAFWLDLPISWAWLEIPLKSMAGGYTGVSLNLCAGSALIQQGNLVMDYLLSWTMWKSPNNALLWKSPNNALLLFTFFFSKFVVTAIIHRHMILANFVNHRTTSSEGLTNT